MHGDSARVRKVDDRLQVGRRQCRTTAAIVRILQADQRRSRHIMRGGPDCSRHLRRVEPTTGVVGDQSRLHPGDRGRSPQLVVEDVGLAPGDQLIPARTMGQRRHQVAHRPRGHEQGRFLAHPLGGDLLQPLHCWVLSPAIIADLCGRHRSPHRLGRLCYRIGAQIDPVQRLLLILAAPRDQNRATTGL